MTMGTPLHAQAELSNDPLSQLSPEDITDLGTEDADFLRQLAVVFNSGGPAATRWAIHAVRDDAGMPHGIGKLDTLVADGKSFYFVARRRNLPDSPDKPEDFENLEEFVVK